MCGYADGVLTCVCGRVLFSLYCEQTQQTDYTIRMIRNDTKWLQPCERIRFKQMNFKQSDTQNILLLVRKGFIQLNRIRNIIYQVILKTGFLMKNVIYWNVLIIQL